MIIIVSHTQYARVYITRKNQFVTHKLTTNTASEQLFHVPIPLPAVHMRHARVPHMNVQFFVVQTLLPHTSACASFETAHHAAQSLSMAIRVWAFRFGIRQDAGAARIKYK